MRPSVLTLLLLCGTIQAKPPEADVVTKLPARAEDAAVAGGGRYLVLRLKATRELTVYDATTQKLTQIELPEEDYLFAAGGDTAVVYLRERNELRAYDLKSGKLLKSKEFLDKPNLVAMVMGHSRSDLAMLRINRTPGVGVPAGSPVPPDLFLDLPEMKVQSVKYAPQMVGGRSGEQNQIRANGDMSRITEWSAILQPIGAGLISRTESGYSYLFGYVAIGPVIPGDDGRVYTSYGTTMEPDPTYNPGHGGSPFKISQGVKSKTLIPSIGGQFHLAVTREGGLTLYHAKSSDPICPLGEFPTWSAPKPDASGFPGGGAPGVGIRLSDGRTVPYEEVGPGGIGEGKESLTLERRIVFAPSQGHIVFLPHSNDKIIYRSFDLKSTLDQTGEEYLMILSSPSLRVKGGSAWEYQLQSVAKHGPVKFELVKSPEGMTIAADGKMKWPAPKGIIGKAPVEVKVIDAKGQLVRQAFDVVID